MPAGPRIRLVTESASFPAIDRLSDAELFQVGAAFGACMGVLAGLDSGLPRGGVLVDGGDPQAPRYLGHGDPDPGEP